MVPRKNLRRSWMRVAEEFAPRVEENAVKAKIDDVTKAAKIEKLGAGLDPALEKQRSDRLSGMQATWQRLD